jgi:hypothetical protein
MKVPVYNECIAVIASAYAAGSRLRDWCALAFYMQVTQPGLRWHETIHDWVAID